MRTFIAIEKIGINTGEANFWVFHGNGLYGRYPSYSNSAIDCFNDWLDEGYEAITPDLMHKLIETVDKSDDADIEAAISYVLQANK